MNRPYNAFRPMVYTERLPIAGPGLANFSFPEKTAVMVVGDSHGQVDALRGALDLLGRFVTPGMRRILVFTGDWIDRGPDSLGCLNVALREAQDRTYADEVVFLPGNHELMLADTIRDLQSGKQNSYAGGIWLANGGMTFLEDTWERSNHNRPAKPAKAILGLADMLPHPGHASFLEMVRSWPSHYQIGDLLCVHAGVLQQEPLAYTLDLAQEEGLPTAPGDLGVHHRHWAWIRGGFLGWKGGWPLDGKPIDPDTGRGMLIIHGHTIPDEIGRDMETGEDLDRVFNKMTTEARICVDGGAAKGLGVATCMVTAEGVRIAYTPA